jgi:hypothetical protein
VAAAPLHADTANAATASAAMARDRVMNTKLLLCVAPCPARSLDRCLGVRTVRAAGRAGTPFGACTGDETGPPGWRVTHVLRIATSAESTPAR